MNPEEFTFPAIAMTEFSYPQNYDGWKAEVFTSHKGMHCFAFVEIPRLEFLQKMRGDPEIALEYLRERIVVAYQKVVETAQRLKKTP